MKASKLIQALVEIIATEGDLEVQIPIDSDRFGFEPVHRIKITGPDWLNKDQDIPQNELHLIAEGN